MKTNCFVRGIAVLGLIALAAGCQSGPRSGADRAGALALGHVNPASSEPLDRISMKELRAYCPRLVLKQGTAFFNEYEKGGEDDRSKIRYQASISDVTRSCKYVGDTLTMNVAAAGKVVPGPVASGQPPQLPIRVVVLRGDEVLYSQLHTHQVPVTGGVGATQFIFNDPGVQFPSPTEPNIQVLIGFDEQES